MRNVSLPERDERHVSRPRRIVLPALVALAAVSCGRSDSPTAAGTPSRDLAAVQTATAGTLPLLRGAPVDGPSSVTRTLDREGGDLTLAGHVLTVPRGAVSRPTRFTLALANDGYVHVELTALQQDDTGAWTGDAGGRGFDEPVVLKLSYEGTRTVGSVGLLEVVWLRNGTADGPLEEVESTVDPNNRWVVARLAHFSGYAIATGM